jgi:serine/threonine protein kinase
MPELIGETLGNYSILDEIGRGGMADVFKALDIESGETVAVKILSPQLNLDSKIKARFTREAKVLSGLQHPNIVPILDFGESNGMIYIVMPFMEVGTLHDRMLVGRLRLRDCAVIIDQVAAALQHAHEAGVVHRDVKPSNILFDSDGNAWLSDFGFAHVTDASLSLTGSALIGTPAYISPEQINGNKINHLSDQYSLAILLYQMCTGSLPFNADTPLAIIIKHATEPLPRPRMVNPRIPDIIEAVLIKALAKDPDQRYSSVVEFNDAFQNALQQVLDPVTGSPLPSTVGRTPEPITIEPDTFQEEAAEEDEKTKWKYAWALLLLLIPIVSWSISALGLIPVLPAGQNATASPTIDLTAMPTEEPTETSPAVFLSPTPNPDPCLNLTLTNFDVQGTRVNWSLSNGSSTSVLITAIHINWPIGNAFVDYIEMGEDVIWDLQSYYRPTHIDAGWKSGVDRSVDGTNSKMLMFHFGVDAGSAAYNLQVVLDNGCTLLWENEP